ncbi:spore protease YyaC [Halonatronum saccharophilum]|uniref:spore protease YyaC n=1 Tax=Halonatronum saccharophilum TaxID=150060 RepID=UPI0004804646|nr:spore protease YyaC [Halonatronum saccharophilum]
MDKLKSLIQFNKNSQEQLKRQKLLKQSRVDINDPLAINNLKKLIKHKLKNKYDPLHQDLVLICIGSDRSTGDSLGPLTGSKLNNFNFDKKVSVLGSLESPVHAKNLQETLNYIDKNYSNPFIIAIDASLGKSSSVGSISINDGALKPGSGVNKNLPEVGDIHITGLVNVSGYMEYFVLQSTRLHIVVQMSKIIAYSLVQSIKSIYN